MGRTFPERRAKCVGLEAISIRKLLPEEHLIVPYAISSGGLEHPMLSIGQGPQQRKIEPAGDGTVDDSRQNSKEVDET